jgi:hypothetical protein
MRSPIPFLVAQFRQIRWSLRVLFAATVGVAVVAVAQLPSLAYTLATLPPSTADTQNVTATLVHSKVNNRDPLPGDQFTYTGTFTVSGTPAGTTSTTTVTLLADPNAPFLTTPTTADFKLNGAAVTGTVSNCSTTACTVTFTNIAAGTLVFSKDAKMNSSLPNGTVIMASANLKVTTTPTVGLTNVSSTPIPAGQCSGTYTFVQKVEPSGAWLADMKFGDLSGAGKVTLSPGDRTIRAWNDPLAAGDTVKFVAADGTDITANVMSQATYRANDPSVPYYIGIAAGGPGQYANTRWIDSLNWPYDPSTWTGTTWLPAGTTITVQRQVTYLNCLPGGFTSDGTTAREFGISTEVGRATTSPQTGAFDVFATPGYNPPAWCASSIYASSNPASSPTALYTWNPGVSKTALGGPGIRTDAVAASPDYADLIFYASQTGGLAVWDTKALAQKTGTGSTSPPSGETISTFNSLAFAPDGSLWGATGRNLYYLDASQVSSFLKGGNVTWTAGTRLLRRTGSTGGLIIGDLAFDGDGNAWFIAYDTSQNGPVYLGMLSPSQMKIAGAGPNDVSNTMEVTALKSLSLRGLAFLGDKLYLGAMTNNASSSYLYEVYWKNVTWGQAAPSPLVSANLYSSSGSNANNIPTASDFASCAFPKKTDSPPPTGPAFKVQKSIINPDGSIAPAGTTGATRTLNSDGSLSIDYLVTVTAVGASAGKFPDITDTVTVPSGFAVSQILLDGTAQTGTASFTIPGATLDPTGATAAISRTYKVTVRAAAANLTSVNWTTAATCNTTAGGTPSAGGFFNLVAMNSDSDGVDNNDACAPVTPPGTASLRLMKRIVDANGNDIAAAAGDAKYFTLVAAGPTTGVAGSSTVSGATAVSKAVVPGTYSLFEQPNDGGTTSGAYGFGGWSCVNNSVPLTVVNNQITVANGDNVTCTVTNTPRPRVYTVKNAASPITGNTHVGTTIVPAADGTFTANYVVTVTSLSDFVSNTGPVNDFFTPPAGTVWDGTKTATISFNPGTTGATVAGGATTASQAQLQNGVTLARSIQRLPARGSVSFTIAIPLKLDNTVAAGFTLTNAQRHAGDLSVCSKLTSGGGTTYTDTATGIPNTVTLVGEDQTYSDIPTADNVACVPVQVKVPAFSVSKSATTGSVVLSPAQTSVTMEYQVIVKNTGEVAGTSAPVYDLPQVPAGFTISSVFVDQATTATAANADGTYTVTTGDALAVGASQTHTVKVTFAVKQSSVDPVAIGACDTGTSPDTSKGVYNAVTMAGDSDGAANNHACVPVQLTRTIRLHKFASNCDVGLPTCNLSGATFAIYDTDPIVNSTAQPIPNGLVVDSGNASNFTSTQLAVPKTYWLVETKAPAGFSLLPTPVKLNLSTTGITVVSGATSSITVGSGDSFLLNVGNTANSRLPDAGGPGHNPYALVGLTLLLMGVAYRQWNSRLRGRHAAD